MLAKAESGNTVFPPAEGFERLGSRVPSAGTGMGTWSLLVGGLSPDPALPAHDTGATESEVPGLQDW